jgi:hypothetical protein
MSSFKTQNKKLHPGTVLIGENGLPVDTVATIASSNRIVENTTQALVYLAGVVTVPVGVDLNPVRFHKSRYTGRLILVTSEGATYFIDRVSVNPATNTFNIYSDLVSTNIPSSIELSSGWVIAEAEIVNRLATTSSAKIDQVEFRDMQFQLTLDGDPVTVVGPDGSALRPNPNGSINVEGELELVEDGVTTPVILNPELPQADTQYVVTIPAEARRFMVKTTVGSLAKLTLRYAVSGPTITVAAGAVYREEGISRDEDLNIYIQSNKPNQSLELVYWT